MRIVSLVLLLAYIVFADRTCLQGWIKEKDSCYRVFHERQIWHKAVEHCENIDSWLVTLNDQEEQTFILQLQSENNEQKLWIGFYRNHTTWTWQKMNETAIDHLVTNTTSNGDCAVTAINGVWIPMDCNLGFPFICETNATGCPTSSGWIEHDFRCLFILTTPLDWENARNECNKIGAELAVLNDLKADSFLQSQTRIQDWLWVGIKFDSNLHNYTWIDGRKGYVDQITTLTPQPQDACGAVSVSPSTRQLISMTTTCKTRLFAVCEKAWISRQIKTFPTFNTTRINRETMSPQFGLTFNPFTMERLTDSPGNTKSLTDSSIPKQNWTIDITTNDNAACTVDYALTTGQIELCNRMVKCLQFEPNICFDDVLSYLKCEDRTKFIGLLETISNQHSVTRDLTISLLKYMISKVSSLFQKIEPALLCIKSLVDVLDMMETIIDNYISDITVTSLYIPNDDISTSIFSMNYSRSPETDLYHEDTIAGCILHSVETRYLYDDLTLSVMVTKTRNQEVRFDKRDGSSDKYFTISAILTISAYRHGVKQNIGHKFTLLHTLVHKTIIAELFTRNTTSIHCAFYSPSSRLWSTSGCKVIKTDDFITSCECNHTTSFAILMKVKDYQMASSHQTVLSVITCIGCSVSMITMFISLTVFTCIRSLISERVFVHRNLCLSIMCAQIIFLAGIKATYHKMVCRVIAIVLHYCYLSVFTWMLVEGLHLYTKVVQVFGTEKSRISYYLFFGWGIPLILVVISTVADFEGYGTDKSCWLSIYRSTIWAFVGPAVAVMVINVVILTMVLRIVVTSVKLERPKHSDQIMAGVKGTLFLLPLLGLTWIFGLLSINRDFIVFEYAFAVCNSLQGFFVFLFHCVFNTEVRQALQRVRDRQTITIRAETSISSTSGDSVRPSEHGNICDNRKTHFLISGSIRVSPAPSNRASGKIHVSPAPTNQALNNTEMKLATTSLCLREFRRST